MAGAGQANERKGKERERERERDKKANEIELAFIRSFSIDRSTRCPCFPPLLPTWHRHRYRQRHRKWDWQRNLRWRRWSASLWQDKRRAGRRRRRGLDGNGQDLRDGKQKKGKREDIGEQKKTLASPPPLAYLQREIRARRRRRRLRNLQENVVQENSIREAARACRRTK